MEQPGCELPPVAPTLMQSFRALGYSVNSAVADLIDNSIGNSATAVDVEFAASPEPFVAIVDDGAGMHRADLVEAMRFGSRDPREDRSESDLGRFGLGMKTASLSQCRRVTVLSKRGGSVHAVEWDLDACEAKGKWWLRLPDPFTEVPELAQRFQGAESGTIVVWRLLDRLAPDEDGRGHALDKAMEGVAEHIGFTFHRFTDRRAANRISIRVNRRPVPEYDPFLEGHPRGQALHPEIFTVESEKVEVSPFVLPFPSRLSQDDLARAGGQERIKSGHGFYVYRGRRLVVAGGWFRIVPADELVRLARIRVDVPTSLDHLWKTDIRKTVLEPPRALRNELRRIVGAAAQRSRRIYTFRSNITRDERHRPLWVRQTHRDHAVYWKIDRNHPAVTALAGKVSGDAERLLQLIEEALPIHDIHVHLSNDLQIEESHSSTETELEDLARRMLDAVESQPDMKASMFANLVTIEPFSRYPEIAQRIKEKLSQE